MYPGSAVMIGDRELCTAGFVVRNPKGARMMFTAGHCDVGGSVKAMVDGAWVPAGRFVTSTYWGSGGDDADIGVIMPKSSLAVTSAVDAELPVGGYVPLTMPGMTLCKWGAATGRSCGPVITSSPSKVKFSARIAPGDSGGPVWGYTPSGQAVAVGITIRQAADDGNPVAELIGPWMDRWQLSLEQG